MEVSNYCLEKTEYLERVTVFIFLITGCINFHPSAP